MGRRENARGDIVREINRDLVESFIILEQSETFSSLFLFFLQSLKGHRYR